MNGSPARLVARFHEAFGLDRRSVPGLVPSDVASARQRLLDEEVAEVAEAVARQDVVSIAHELADVVYVAYGTALAYGIDLDAVLAEVHRANMTKLDSGGRPIIVDGKVRKGESYRPPDVAGALSRAGGSAESTT